MAGDHDPAQASKKRRPARSGNGSIDVGGHAISLEGYLNEPAPKSKPSPAPALARAVSGKLEEKSVPKEGSAGDSAVAGVTAATDVMDLDGDHQSADDGGRPGYQPKWKDDPDLLKTREKLPIWRYGADILSALDGPGRNVLVVVGETGSGKSTQVPQLLFREGWCRRRKIEIGGGDGTWVGGMVAVTQPRRVAATTLAHRVASEAGTPFRREGDGNGGKGGGKWGGRRGGFKGGKRGGDGEREQEQEEGLVGYSVRFDHRVPRGARIKYMTEGMLLQELLRDGNLRQYSAVVVDEIHERSIDVDLLVGFLRQIVDGDLAGRGGVPLKVVMMSATADVDVIRGFWQQPQQQPQQVAPHEVTVLRIEGRQHPVEILYAPGPVDDIRDAVLEAVFHIHLHEPMPGDILAFLSGQEEIESVEKLIEKRIAALPKGSPWVRVFPLYGQLSVEKQRRAFRPIPDYEMPPPIRKVVLATNIAETSVTVPGVRYVIDGGKAKVRQFRPQLGLDSLLAKPISKSSAIQRAGRAGREAPGKCFRLYTEEAYDGLADADPPEILRGDVLGAMLAMKARGVHDVFAFPLMSPPDPDAVGRALQQLRFLGGLDDGGAITEQGRQMALLPVSAAFAKVLITAAAPQFDCVAEVIDIIACLTAGEDLFYLIRPEEPTAEAVEALRSRLYRRESDLLTCLSALRHYLWNPGSGTSWCRDRAMNGRTMVQAVSIRRQLRALCQQAGLYSAAGADGQPAVMAASLPRTQADNVLKCFVRGFAFRTAVLAPDASYTTVRGRHVVAIHPSSVLHRQKREAILFLEHVFTTKNYAKRVSAIKASWIAEALEGGW